MKPKLFFACFLFAASLSAQVTFAGGGATITGSRATIATAPHEGAADKPVATAAPPADAKSKSKAKAKVEAEGGNSGSSADRKPPHRKTGKQSSDRAKTSPAR
jgi:hypothetical protein